MIEPALELQSVTPSPAETPDYTVYLSRNRDRMWVVTITVTATGQELSCAYYVEPRYLNVPAIAARLYELRRTE